MITATESVALRERVIGVRPEAPAVFPTRVLERCWLVPGEPAPLVTLNEARRSAHAAELRVAFLAVRARRHWLHGRPLRASYEHMCAAAEDRRRTDLYRQMVARANSHNCDENARRRCVARLAALRGLA